MIIIFFSLTLVIVVHNSTVMIFKDHHANTNFTHPLLDPTDVPAFLLHNLAYYIACIATTVFLLICMAIAMGLVTMIIEIATEAFVFLRSIRTVRPLQRGEAEQNDPECDSWNYR